jgi:hypothetical protein
MVAVRIAKFEWTPFSELHPIYEEKARMGIDREDRCEGFTCSPQKSLKREDLALYSARSERNLEVTIAEGAEFQIS